MIRRGSYTAVSLRRRVQPLQKTRLQQSSFKYDHRNVNDILLSSRSLATSVSTRMQSASSKDDNSSMLTIGHSRPRLLSVMAAANSSSSSTDNKNGKRDDSNLFLDNLGKIFLSSIGIVLLMLLRSTKSNNSRAALREEMENAALLDPLEIDDLRTANAGLTIGVWDAIVEEIKKEFIDARGVHSVTYPQFLSLVIKVMKDVKGEGFTIQLGQFIDRVVIAELERRSSDKWRMKCDENDVISGDKEGSDKLPLSFLLVSLSLALNSTVSDRIRVLYESMLLFEKDNDGASSTSTRNIASEEQVECMIQHLQSTCQLVPEAQIVETNSKVPYQTFRVGTGKELTRRAREGYGGKKGSQGVTKEVGGPVTLEDFHAILKSRTVCAWGECYIKKASRTSTSDR